MTVRDIQQLTAPVTLRAPIPAAPRHTATPPA